MLVQLPSIFGRDAINHLRSIEGPRHLTWPLLPLQKPVHQQTKNLVRINDVSMLIHSTDAIRIAICDQSRITFLRDDSLHCCLNMRHDRLRINPWKRWIYLASDLNERHTRLREDARDHAASGAIHVVDQELVSRGSNCRNINEACDSSDVFRVEVNRLNRSRLLRPHQRLPQIAFNSGHDRRLARAAVASLVL